MSAPPGHEVVGWYRTANPHRRPDPRWPGRRVVCACGWARTVKRPAVAFALMWAHLAGGGDRQRIRVQRVESWR